MRPYKDREHDRSKPVMVYRNLADEHNGLGRWSIMQGDLVIGHNDRVVLIGLDDNEGNVEYVVRPAGHERAVREGRKNVHAFFKGEYFYNWPGFLMERWVAEGVLREVSYDHKRGDQFFDVATDTDLHGSGMVYLNEKGAYYA